MRHDQGARLARSTSRAWTALALAAVLAASSACTLASAAVSCAVRFESTRDAAPIQDLSAIVGGEKLYAGRLQPGDQWQGTFAPGPRDDRQLHLLYREAGRRRLWLGPTVPVGADYRIEVRLQDGEVVRFRHCLQPCELAPQPWLEGRSTVND